MGYQIFLSVAPIFLILIVFCIGVVLRYRAEFTARPLIVYLSLSLWLLAVSSCELIVPTAALKVLCAKLEYIGYMYIPVAFMSFAFRYTGYVKYTRLPLILIALAVPTLSLVAVWTNELHGLFWRELSFPAEHGLAALRPTYGILFWLGISYVYLMVLAGLTAIIRSYLHGPDIFRRQSLTIVAGMIVPGFLNSLYVLRLVPQSFHDFTPIGLAVTGVLFSAGVFLNRFLRLLPVARAVILDQIDTGVILLNRDGFLIDMNKAVSDWTGLEYRDVGTHVDDLPRILELAGTDRLVSPFREFDSVRHLCGKTFSVRLRTLYDVFDRPAGYMITMNNITERVRQLDELTQMKAQMLQCEKLAAIGQIAAGVAHEINNPLGYLTSEFRSLKALLDRPGLRGDETVRADLSEIIGSVETGLDRIESVVKNLLSFSRQGKAGDTFEPYDLNRGITSTLEICRNEYRDTVRIELELGELPPLRCRKNEINQVILNIVTNATHAIRRAPGGPRQDAYIRIRTALEDHRTVVCEISNNGPPVPEEYRGRIFEPFFTTAEAGVGTGLGLSVVKDIVENRHGGTIALASVDPVTFRFTLPVPEREEPDLSDGHIRSRHALSARSQSSG